MQGSSLFVNGRLNDPPVKSLAVRPGGFGGISFNGFAESREDDGMFTAVVEEIAWTRIE